MTTLKKYSVTYRCWNCDYRFTKFFIFEQEAPDKVICARCGCLRAHKETAYNGPAPRIPWPSPYLPNPWKPRPRYPGVPPFVPWKPPIDPCDPPYSPYRPYGPFVVNWEDTVTKDNTGRTR